MQSPLKQNQRGKDLNTEMGGATGANRRLDLDGGVEASCQQARKRKSKGVSPVTQTLDLNIPLGCQVPSGLVSFRVNQLGATADSGGSSMIELLKKQKRGNNNTERSVAAVVDSPRWVP